MNMKGSNKAACPYGNQKLLFGPRVFKELKDVASVIKFFIFIFANKYEKNH